LVLREKKSRTGKWILMKFGTGKFKGNLTLPNFYYNLIEMRVVLPEDICALLLACGADILVKPTGLTKYIPSPQILTLFAKIRRKAPELLCLPFHPLFNS
jgi:hypothetical protein